MKKTTLSGSMPRQKLLLNIVRFPWLKKATIVEIISLWFVILFIYTGLAKLLDFYVFKAQLSESPVLEPVAEVIAWGLPITEFIISLLLFFPRYRLYGLYATFLIMIGFTGYVLAVLTTSSELPCSCGGIIEELSWTGHVIFNSSMILLSWAAVKIQRRIIRTTTLSKIHEQ